MLTARAPVRMESFVFNVHHGQPLNIAWKNRNGSSTICVSDDPTVNLITVTLSNNTAKPFVFAAGTPVAYGDALAGSALYVSFSGLLAASEIGTMTVGPASSWTAAAFSSASLGEYLCICPVQKVEIAPGESVSFTIQGFVCQDALNAGQVMFMPEQVAGYDGTAPIQVFVQIVNPPQPKLGPLPVLAGFMGADTVTIGQQANSLILFMTNTLGTPLVPAGTVPKTPPSFMLGFVFDPAAADALTSVQAAGTMEVNLGATNGNAWQPVVKNTDGPVPTWTMAPASGNTTLLGPATAPSATITFNITGIVTELPAGTTLASLSYWNVAGYNDGNILLPIAKAAPLAITSFTATAASPVSVPGTSPAGSMPSYTLNFTVENAESVVVTNTTYTNQNPGPSLTGSVSVTATAPTTYTLIATNHTTGQRVAESVTTMLDPNPYQVAPLGTILMWSSPTIPAGWVICDGTPYNGIAVPDLVNSFILGAGSSPRASQPLGTSSPGDSHVHSFSTTVPVKTNFDGSHFHTLAVGSSTSCSDWGSGTYVLEQVIMSNDPVDGSHQHSFPVAIPATDTGLQIVNGSSGSVPLPPYYALYFIMKVY